MNESKKRTMAITSDEGSSVAVLHQPRTEIRVCVKCRGEEQYTETYIGTASHCLDCGHRYFCTFLIEESGGYGRARIQMNDGSTHRYDLKRPLDETETESWIARFREPDVDTERCLLTHFDGEKLVTVFGKA